MSKWGWSEETWTFLRTRSCVAALQVAENQTPIHLVVFDKAVASNGSIFLKTIMPIHLVGVPQGHCIQWVS
jgi:hypothetical protein